MLNIHIHFSSIANHIHITACPMPRLKVFNFFSCHLHYVPANAKWIQVLVTTPFQYWRGLPGCAQNPSRSHIAPVLLSCWCPCMKDDQPTIFCLEFEPVQILLSVPDMTMAGSNGSLNLFWTDTGSCASFCNACTKNGVKYCFNKIPNVIKCDAKFTLLH